MLITWIDRQAAEHTGSPALWVGAYLSVSVCKHIDTVKSKSGEVTWLKRERLIERKRIRERKIVIGERESD